MPLIAQTAGLLVACKTPASMQLGRQACVMQLSQVLERAVTRTNGPHTTQAWSWRRKSASRLWSLLVTAAPAHREVVVITLLFAAPQVTAVVAVVLCALAATVSSAQVSSHAASQCGLRVCCPLL